MEFDAVIGDDEEIDPGGVQGRRDIGIALDLVPLLLPGRIGDQHQHRRPAPDELVEPLQLGIGVGQDEFGNPVAWKDQGLFQLTHRRCGGPGERQALKQSLAVLIGHLGSVLGAGV